MNSRWKKIILISILSVILVSGGIILTFAYTRKTGSLSSSNTPPHDKQDNPKENKVEIKVSWYGSPVLYEEYKNYWMFVDEKNPANRFLISHDFPVLVDKDLEQENLFFTLAYSEKEVKIKKVEKNIAKEKLF